MIGRISRIHLNMYNVLKERAKKNNSTVTEESKNLVEEHRQMEALTDKLGLDVRKNKQKWPLWIIKP